MPEPIPDLNRDQTCHFYQVPNRPALWLARTQGECYSRVPHPYDFNLPAEKARKEESPKLLRDG